MANVISLNDKSYLLDSFSMSNGATSVFINTFGLSGSALAKTDIERKLVVWVLEKNQSIVGVGTVGFSISDMPWDLELFDENINFLLSVLDGMRNKMGWEQLQYFPNEDILFGFIDQFRELILKMKPCDINFEEIESWHNDSDEKDPINQGFPTCPIHNVLLTVHGCQVCTD